MSLFSRTLRSPAARTATRTALPAFRQQAARRAYATEAPKAGNNSLLYGLIAAGLVGGGAYYALNQSPADPTKIKNAASTSQVDYQKVYNAIAEVLESEDYDGA